MKKTIFSFALFAFSVAKCFPGTNAPITLNTNTGQLSNLGFATGGQGLLWSNPVTGAWGQIPTNSHIHLTDEHGSTYDFKTNGTLSIVNTNGQSTLISNGNILISGAFAGNQSGLTNGSGQTIAAQIAAGGGGGSFNPTQINTNGSSQVTVYDLSPSVLSGTIAATNLPSGLANLSSNLATGNTNVIFLAGINTAGGTNVLTNITVMGTNTPIWSANGNIYNPTYLSIYNGSNSPGIGGLAIYGDYRSGGSGERYATILSGNGIITCSGAMSLDGNGGATVGIPDFDSSMLNIADDVNHGIVQAVSAGLVFTYQMFSSPSGGLPTNGDYPNGMETMQILGDGQITLLQPWQYEDGPHIQLLLSEAQTNQPESSSTGKTNTFGIEVYNGLLSIGLATGSGVNTNGTNWTGTNAAMASPALVMDTNGNITMPSGALTNESIGGFQSQSASTGNNFGNTFIYDNVGSPTGYICQVQDNNGTAAWEVDGNDEMFAWFDASISGSLGVGGPLTTTNAITASGLITAGGGYTATSNSVFTGNGSGLTNLNASSLASGTIATGVLPPWTNYQWLGAWTVSNAWHSNSSGRNMVVKMYYVCGLSATAEMTNTVWRQDQNSNRILPDIPVDFRAANFGIITNTIDVALSPGWSLLSTNQDGGLSTNSTNGTMLEN